MWFSVLVLNAAHSQKKIHARKTAARVVTLFPFAVEPEPPLNGDGEAIANRGVLGESVERDIAMRKGSHHGIGARVDLHNNVDHATLT